MKDNPFSIKSVHHGAFATCKLEETIYFWRDILGFRLVATLNRNNERQYFFSMPGGPMVAFFEWPKSKTPLRKRHGEPFQGRVGFDHLAFEVGSIDDLSALQNQFIDHDYAASELIDHGFLYSLYSFDPNNVAIEFVYPKPDADLNRDPLLKDNAPPHIVDESPAQPKYVADPDSERIIIKGEWSQFFED